MGPVLSLVLVAVTVGSLLQQLRTVRRHGTAGLAPSTWFGLVASALLWLGYGVATQAATVVVVNVLVLAVALLLAGAIVRATGLALARLVPYLLWPGLVWGIAWAPDAAWLLAVVGTVVVLGRLVPQLVQAARSHDRSGVSVVAWLGNAATNLVWAAYGLDLGDPLVWWPSIASTVLSLVIVVLAARGRPRPRLRVPRRLQPVDA